MGCFLSPTQQVIPPCHSSLLTFAALASRQVHTSAPSRRDINVPDFGPYRTSNEESNRALSYFFIGSMGVLSATAAKSTVTDFLATMAASADVLALAKVEVEMNSIPEGKNVIIKWRGKPVFIRHRTQDEISEANSVDVKSLRDPEADSARVKKPEWLVMLGVCTHLGCVPIGESGDYGGWWVLAWLHALLLMSQVLPVSWLPLRHLGSHPQGPRSSTHRPFIHPAQLTSHSSTSRFPRTTLTRPRAKLSSDRYKSTCMH